ncbi:ribosomal protein L37AE/L43A [Peribacillus deserti]|uniref:Ribosomal protein L37AE/L43A n=1 Tax=Peribacillus deserti TaxID=673318 RepID=A0ABS2QM39_9BACI|nr:nuclease-related domain-containing protein [Peribacillus deserti]MBM7694030.1 ribosomal protein L37AE/L43A [Peribacillus deserti]
MIVKERKIPIHILKLEALLRRLPDSHPKYSKIEGDLAKRWAGYRGEQSLEYYLESLSENEYFILHDLRLKNGNYFFQIDTLILSTKFALILEVKNIAGELFFDKSFNQLIRKQNNKEEGFSNPITQTKRQQMQLNSWLALNKISPLPVEYLIVISNSASIIKTQTWNTEAFKKVCHAGEVVEKIERIENLYNKYEISSKEIRKLIKVLLKSHHPQTQDILHSYDINRSEIRTGIQCPSCAVFSLIRAYGRWLCNSCFQKFKDAHRSALADYFLLINGTIKNQDFREFCHIPSRHIATQLLNSLNLPHTGTNKSRIYHEPPNFLESMNEVN